MKKYFIIVIFVSTVLINFTYPQSLTSPYLNNPDPVFGYVDSCAAFWKNAHDSVYGGFFTEIGKTDNVRNLNSKGMLSQSRDAYGYVLAYMFTGNKENTCKWPIIF